MMMRTAQKYLLRLRLNRSVARLGVEAWSWEPFCTPRLTESDVRALAALCGGQAITHLLAPHGDLQRMTNWTDLQRELLASIPEKPNA